MLHKPAAVLFSHAILVQSTVFSLYTFLSLLNLVVGVFRKAIQKSRKKEQSIKLMKKAKLSLEDLKVNSFTTAANEVKAGRGSTNNSIELTEDPTACTLCFYCPGETELPIEER